VLLLNKKSRVHSTRVDPGCLEGGYLGGGAEGCSSRQQQNMAEGAAPVDEHDAVPWFEKGEGSTPILSSVFMHFKAALALMAMNTSFTMHLAGRNCVVIPPNVPSSAEFKLLVKALLNEPGRAFTLDKTAPEHHRFKKIFKSHSQEAFMGQLEKCTPALAEKLKALVDRGFITLCFSLPPARSSGAPLGPGSGKPKPPKFKCKACLKSHANKDGLWSQHTACWREASARGRFEQERIWEVLRAPLGLVMSRQRGSGLNPHNKAVVQWREWNTVEGVWKRSELAAKKPLTLKEFIARNTVPEHFHGADRTPKHCRLSVQDYFFAVAITAYLRAAITQSDG